MAAAGVSTSLYLPQRGATKVFYFTRSSGCGVTSAAVVVDFDPAPAQITASFRWHVNHMGVFLNRFIGGVLPVQLEVELRRLVRVGFGVPNRGFYGAVNKRTTS